MAAGYARMREIAEELSQLPESWAVEISGKEIIMMMSPALRHEMIVAQTAKQLNAELDKVAPQLLAHGGAEIEDPEAGVLRRPDLLILPWELLDAPGDYIDPREIMAAVEVVSKSNPENDYAGKMRDYPRIGIPVYVIIDPRVGTGAVLHEVGPGQDDDGTEAPAYQQRETFAFGETVRVGEWHLDTSQFPTY